MKDVVPFHNVIGRKVGAKRWPFHGSHPDCWGRPHAGIVIPIDDPRAWAGSVAFPGDYPEQSAVTAHVALIQARGHLLDTVPVLWNFPEGPKVLWENFDNLRDYDEDVAEWEAERTDARRHADMTSAATS